MKAALYAVRQSQRWNWHLSLDLQVDLHYWSESTELEERTVMVSDSLLPLGRAVEWRHWLQRRRNGWVLPDGLSFRKMQATEQGSGLRGFFHHGNGPLREFARHLQGRALLPGEAADLLTQTGCKEGQTEWKKYVQAACLLGLAAFTGGIERDSRRTLPFLQTAYRYTCKRCGNDRRERFYQTMCASCGEICAYCEECLNMGKNRFCTPLIEGARQADRPNWGEDTEPLPDLRRWIAPREAAGLDRWGLSPAQREASQAGIAFLQGARVSGAARSCGPSSGACSQARPAAFFALGGHRSGEDGDGLPDHRVGAATPDERAGRHAAQGCGAGAGAPGEPGLPAA